MIYFSGLDSIIESIYLNDEIDNKIGSCEVFINPDNVKYIIGKTVIINLCDYPNDKINILNSNGCHIISRVYNSRDDIEVQPYILRLNFSIMWNGRFIDTCDSLDSLLDKDKCTYDLENKILYFPKIKNIKQSLKVEDEYKNLTVFGWALQQVGVNLKNSTVFENLDIIKTKKTILC